MRRRSGTGLVALRDAVSAFLDGAELGEAVRARVTEELSVTDDLDWSPEDRVAFGKLAEEIALLTVDPGQDEVETPDDIGDSLADDDSSGTPLRAFAADLSTPAALAARALAWHEHIHYGLWRIDDPVPAPGLRCIDIVSGTERYVEFPADATAALPRWTVWLGGIVPARYDDLVTGREEPIDVSAAGVPTNGIELQDREFVAAITQGREPNSSIADVLGCYRVLGELETQLASQQ